MSWIWRLLKVELHVYRSLCVRFGCSSSCSILNVTDRRTWLYWRWSVCWCCWRIYTYTIYFIVTHELNTPAYLFWKQRVCIRIQIRIQIQIRNRIQSLRIATKMRTKHTTITRRKWANARQTTTATVTKNENKNKTNRDAWKSAS